MNSAWWYVMIFLSGRLWLCTVQDSITKSLNCQLFANFSLLGFLANATSLFCPDSGDGDVSTLTVNCQLRVLITLQLSNTQYSLQASGRVKLNLEFFRFLWVSGSEKYPLPRSKNMLKNAWKWQSIHGKATYFLTAGKPF